MKMKIGLLGLFTVLLFAGSSYGQTSSQRIGVGAHLGISDYYGDLDTRFFNIGTARNQGGVTGSYYLNKWFDVAASATYGGIGYNQASGPSFSANLFQATGQLRFKFHNGIILPEESKIQPFVFVGAGIADWATVGLNDKYPKGTVPQTDLLWSGGLGATYMILDNWGVNYTLLYGYTNGDSKDFYAGFSGGHDQFMIHQAGIVYLIGKVSDTDGDGVSDKKDDCPETPAGVAVDEMGCAIDTDGDGIADYLDKCPDVPGVEELDGCPDSDGDGITDLEDECPDVFGVISAQGCPDTDGDGITDEDDACPEVAGLDKYDGCPDTDGDGIIDSEDDCPTVKGIKELKGCADTDGDGIADNIDKCPTIPGVDSNMGCPEIAEATKEVFKKALKGIQFESGRDVIKSSSNGILNNVADIMKENPSYKLIIDGHTDSQGDDAKNLELSEKRALAVKNYLIKRGIDPARLTSRGFGETKPKASNDTSNGRAENRRVEFTVEF
jgi:OOP family OmpA-OmpF porin